MGPAQATQATFATMTPGQLARLAWVVARVPVKLLVLAIMNIANLVAHDFVFAQIKRRIGSPGNMKMNMTINSTKDVAFMFSLDSVMVSWYC